MPQPASDTLSPRTRLALAVLALVLFFGGLGSYPLLEPDEGRYAEIPREMLERGDFVTPKLNGVLYFEKPPLYYWLNAAALSLPGRPEVLCRLFSALFGLAGVGLAWALGRSIGGPRVGLTAAIVLGSSPLWAALSRANIIDMTLAFFLSATLTCFWLAQNGERGERLLWYGMFAAAALATLTKGLIGFLIPGAVIFLYLLFAWRWRLLLRVPWIGGIALFLAIAVPWHVLAARRNPDFLWFYFVHEHWLRYTTSEAKRQAPAWFFFGILAVGLIPWSGLLPASARLYRRSWGKLREERPGLIFLACWALFILLFFSASQSKLVPYILPGIPPLAVLAALALREAETDPRTRTWARVGGAIGALLLAVLAAGLLLAALGTIHTGVGPLPNVLVFAMPTLAAGLLSVWLWGSGRLRSLPALAVAPALLVLGLVSAAPRASLLLSTGPIARFLIPRLTPGDEVYAYRCYPQTLPIYLRRLVGVVEYKGELDFGIQHLAPEERARRYPTAAEFRPLWSSGKTVYVVLEAEKLPRMRLDGLAAGRVLMRQDKYLLLTNRPAPSRVE
ncbi:MAG TPA: phospholipid carrier-dependent glycosyltransferase [Thermoanaerobaculia bacterium]|nr:phospholipid carrier-dependent glycosyltransferase [Thermoanaerobaculia bacterium]